MFHLPQVPQEVRMLLVQGTHLGTHFPSSLRQESVQTPFPELLVNINECEQIHEGISLNEKRYQPMVVVNAFTPSTTEAEADGSL